MAARVMASKGAVVVEPAREFYTEGILKASVERDGIVNGIEGLIDALDERGIVDRTRVALVGFSRTGMYVHTFLAFSDYPVAVATVADSIAMTPSCYSGAYGLPYPSMLEFESPNQMGAPFWGETGIRSWQERSYLFHLDRIGAPIRYEVHAAPHLYNWDVFAIMKRMGRPVEMISFPRGAHNLVTPLERLTSQQGNVDWILFWLMGIRNASPLDDTQYERWSALRRQLETTRSSMRGQRSGLAKR
jgi:hypothetical protein